MKMGYILEIEDDELETLSEGMEEILHKGGKLMSCIERLKESTGSGYGRRMGRRKEEDWDDDDDLGMRHGTGMGYRRARDSRGRYM